MTGRRAREVVEGALACALGRESGENVYSRDNAPDQHALWALGWNLADCLIEREFQAGLAELGEAA